MIFSIPLYLSWPNSLILWQKLYVFNVRFTCVSTFLGTLSNLYISISFYKSISLSKNFTLIKALLVFFGFSTSLVRSLKAFKEDKYLSVFPSSLYFSWLIIDSSSSFRSSSLLCISANYLSIHWTKSRFLRCCFSF